MAKEMSDSGNDPASQQAEETFAQGLERACIARLPTEEIATQMGLNTVALHMRTYRQKLSLVGMRRKYGQPLKDGSWVLEQPLPVMSQPSYDKEKFVQELHAAFQARLPLAQIIQIFGLTQNGFHSRCAAHHISIREMRVTYGMALTENGQEPLQQFISKTRYKRNQQDEVVHYIIAAAQQGYSLKDVRRGVGKGGRAKLQAVQINWEEIYARHVPLDKEISLAENNLIETNVDVTEAHLAHIYQKAIGAEELPDESVIALQKQGPVLYAALLDETLPALEDQFKLVVQDVSDKLLDLPARDDVTVAKEYPSLHLQAHVFLYCAQARSLTPQG